MPFPLQVLRHQARSHFDLLCRHIVRRTFALLTHREDSQATCHFYYTSIVVFRVLALDHVQLAAPPGCEAAARKFYAALLGMAEMEKPAELRARGGCWFQCGAQQLHIGVQEDFRPAKKAHAAFNVADLEALRDSLQAAGIPIVDDATIPGVTRFYAEDPFGNRLEFQSA
jgi:catechol 2,3-dioxygenase-like lactoylglutathione lyase family enzyme